MPRKEPTPSALKALFAKSQNQCAFPGCTAPLIDADDLFIGQVTHIRAASSGGARFDASQSDDERRHISNLLLLCYPHHISVDRIPDRHSVEELIDIKRRHEQRAASNYEIPPSALSLLARRLNSYWAQLGTIASMRRDRLEVCVDIDVHSSPHELARQVVNLVSELEASTYRDLSIDQVGDGVIYYHNTFQRLRIILRQLEITLLHSLVVMGDGYEGIDADIDRKQKELQRIIEREVVCD
jgi:hypothetical protein